MSIDEDDDSIEERARNLWNGTNGQSKDPDKAKSILQKVAYRGNPKILSYLGYMYHVENQTEVARKFYEEAGRLGHGGSMSGAAMCHLELGESEYNIEKAVEWCRMGVKSDNPVCHEWLGVFYYYGIGVKKNLVEAVRLCLPAADYGLDSAQFNMAWMLEHEDLCRSDHCRDNPLYWYGAAIGGADSPKSELYERALKGCRRVRPNVDLGNEEKIAIQDDQGLYIIKSCNWVKRFSS